MTVLRIFRLFSIGYRSIFALGVVLVTGYAIAAVSWPNLISFTHPEASVTVLGECRDGALQGQLSCAGSWTVDGAPVTGEVVGGGLITGQTVTARVSADQARVPMDTPSTVMITVIPAMMLVVGLWVAFRGRPGLSAEE